ncbi:DNA polymerase III subunit beta [Patescibacteria group bacterium]|nr:DNA polymerase III subunit beta [Patescibacteria group bacterium]MBU1705492.1 DNA polymerase III subunit beta [Patescibacteria group bacterium]
MKISCTRENLYQGLSVTGHLINKGVNLPVLQNVLIKAEGGNIRFTTTNLETAISCSVRGKVDAPGEYTTPTKLFLDYVSLLPNETVEMEIKDDGMRVVCGNHKTRINGVSASEFPLIPTVEASKSYQIKADDFRRALTQVLFASALNESRPELTGVFMRFTKDGGGQVVLAATDSYRLAERTLPLAKAPLEDMEVIVPTKALSEVGRILSVFKDSVDAPGEIVMNLSENQVVFNYGSVELISRIIEGNYPDYRQIIPKQYRTSVMIDREDFIKAVKAASLFSKTGLFDVTLEIAPSKGEFSIRAVDNNRGENVATCTAEITGEVNNVTVNYRYLLDGLNAISTEKILFEMIDPSNPCLITPKEEKKEYLYIVMPIKQ